MMYERGDIVVLDYGGSDCYIGLVLRVDDDIIIAKFWVKGGTRADSIERHQVSGRARPIVNLGPISGLGVDLPASYHNEEWWIE